MGPITDLFGAHEFLVGLLAGLLATAIALPAAWALRRYRPVHGRRPGAVGPAFVVAGVIAIGGGDGLDEIWPVPGGVMWARLLLGLAGFLATRTPVPWLVGPLAAIPGGVFLADSTGGAFPKWVTAMLVLGPALIGVAATDLDRRGARFGIGPVLLGISVMGMYATVPDTEIARVAVGVMLPLVFLAWPRALASVGAAGMYAAIGLYLWIVPIESIG